VIDHWFSGVMVSMLTSSVIDHWFSGVIVSMLTSSVIDCWFQTQSGQIDICCFSAKFAVLRSLSKDYLAQNQDNVSEWSDMSTNRLLFQ
jgi:hypothetical protein